MATIAQRLKREQGTMTVIRGGLRRSISDPGLLDAIKTAHTLWQELGELESRLAEAKGIIAQRAQELMEGGATVSFETGGLRCTVTIRHEAVVPEENVQELRKLLGRRFRDLVSTRVRHTATSRLVHEADDDTLSLIRLRRLSPQFKWSECRGSSEHSS
jgi:hypothetical protein